jgi:hypothetical protein
MANESATMTLPMDLIKPAIDAKVSAAIVEALGGSDKVVSTLIAQLMTKRVDSRGNPSTYHNDSKPWIEWMAEELIRDAIKDGLKAAVDARKVEITEMISKAMKDTKSAFHRNILTAAADGLSASLSNGYSVSVEFKHR